MEWEHSEAVEYDGDILEFVGKTKEDAMRRAAKFCRRHARARLAPVTWDDDAWDEDPQTYFGEE